MKKKLVSMVLVASMAFGLAACGSSDASDSNQTGDSSQTSGSESSDAAAATSTKEDKTTLNIFMASEPAHLDPALNSSVDGGCLAVNSFEGLMRYNESGSLETACAESYTVSDDGLVYTFTMRDGLTCSTGHYSEAPPDSPEERSLPDIRRPFRHKRRPGLK